VCTAKKSHLHDVVDVVVAVVGAERARKPGVNNEGIGQKTGSVTSLGDESGILVLLGYLLLGPRKVEPELARGRGAGGGCRQKVQEVTGGSLAKRTVKVGQQMGSAIRIRI